MHDVDIQLFRWVNGWPDGLRWFFVFLSEGNKWWSVRLALLLIFILLVSNEKTRKPALCAVVAVPFANMITDVLKHSAPAIRPCVELWPNVAMRVGKLDSAGTASAHAANMMAAALPFLFYLRKWGAIPLTVALLVGISRVYVGVHYPSQVLLGWMCGLFMGIVVVKTWEAFVKVRAVKEADWPSEADTGV